MNDNSVGSRTAGLQAPARPGALGDGITSTLSAAEALALVAFNDRRALSGRMQDFPSLWPNAAKLAKRWAEDIEEIMERPIVLSDVTKSFDRRLAALADASVQAGTSSRDGADARRVCKGAMFSARLRRADREWRTREEDVLSASNALREAVSAGAIKVLGKPGSRPRLKIESSNYEEILASVFADPHRQIDRDGWLTMSRQTPLAILRAWRRAPRSDWADLRFQTNPSDLQRILGGLLKISASAPKSEIETSAAQALETQRQHNGLDYRSADELLFPRMRQMIDEGRASSAEDAARALEDEIIGNGKPDSKIKRVAKHYRESANHQS